MDDDVRIEARKLAKATKSAAKMITIYAAYLLVDGDEEMSADVLRSAKLLIKQADTVLEKLS